MPIARVHRMQCLHLSCFSVRKIQALRTTTIAARSTASQAHRQAEAVLRSSLSQQQLLRCTELQQMWDSMRSCCQLCARASHRSEPLRSSRTISLRCRLQLTEQMPRRPGTAPEHLNSNSRVRTERCRQARTLAKRSESPRVQKARIKSLF